jgi:Flp pilus assembly protein TadG
MYLMPVSHFRSLRKLWCETSGVSIIEFALMLPMLMLVGAGGLELIHFVLSNQKIERIASVTADNVARNTLAPSERSFVDSFAAVNAIAVPFDLRADGHVIITGVIGIPEAGNIVGKVVWQRCSGQLAGIASMIGEEATDPARWAEGPNATLPNGITLLQNQLVVVSEVHYRYQPLISFAQFRSLASSDVIRQSSIFVSRGQAFTFVTPVPGVTPARCT